MIAYSFCTSTNVGAREVKLRAPILFSAVQIPETGTPEMTPEMGTRKWGQAQFLIMIRSVVPPICHASFFYPNATPTARPTPQARFHERKILTSRKKRTPTNGVVGDLGVMRSQYSGCFLCRELSSVAEHPDLALQRRMDFDLVISDRPLARFRLRFGVDDEVHFGLIERS